MNQILEKIVAKSEVLKQIPQALLPATDLLVSSCDGGLLSVLRNGEVRLFRQPLCMGLGWGNQHLVASLFHVDYLGLVAFDGNANIRFIRNLCLSDAHDVRFHDGDLYVVSAGTNEIARIDMSGKILQLWKFPGGGDAWHLNCLDVWNGRLVVAAFGKFDHHRGWLGKSAQRGFIFDLLSNEVLWEGLSKPHTPRLDERGWQYVCDSERERVLIRNGDQQSELNFPRTFTRGMAFDQKYIYIGLSAPRHPDTFDVTPRMARIAIVDRITLEVIGKISLPVIEIYDIITASDRGQ